MSHTDWRRAHTRFLWRNCAPNRASDCAPDQTADQAPDSAADCTPDSAADCTPGHVPTRARVAGLGIPEPAQRRVKEVSHGV